MKYYNKYYERKIKKIISLEDLVKCLKNNDTLTLNNNM